MKASRLIIVAAFIAHTFTAAGQSHCTSDHYKLIPLPFHPTRINNAGVVIGTTEDHQAATWTEKSGLHELELPAGFTAADPLAINQFGDIVGAAMRADSTQVAFAYSREKFTPLSESNSKATAISNAGEVAGLSVNDLTLWRKQKPIPLGGCCGGIARAINSHGQVVGQLNDKQGRYNAFLWDHAHGLRSIAPPNTQTSVALAINDAGNVLIQTFTPNAIFLRRAGKFIPVQLALDAASQPLALNNCDVIVGEFGAASDYYHAFVWDRQHGLRDLNRLISADNWILESAVDINDRGEIIGLGTHANADDSGFLLIPIPAQKHSTPGIRR